MIEQLAIVVHKTQKSPRTSFISRNFSYPRRNFSCLSMIAIASKEANILGSLCIKNAILALNTTILLGTLFLPLASLYKQRRQLKAG